MYASMVVSAIAGQVLVRAIAGAGEQLRGRVARLQRDGGIGISRFLSFVSCVTTWIFRDEKTPTQ
jgi:hypothetical protein